MPCRITITGVIGIVPPGATSPASIQVTGTAVDCAGGFLVVKLTCSLGTVQLTVPVSPGGGWTANFTDIANAGCDCSTRVVVEAACKSDLTCGTAREVDSLKCEAPRPCCPTMALT